MPAAATVTESTVSVASATVAVRLDGTPLANRFWVRVVNPNATLRLYVGHTSGTVDPSNWETADPASGVWEGPVGAAVHIYACSENGATIAAKVIQYA